MPTLYLGVFRNITSEQNVFEPIENNAYVIERKNGENLFFGGFTPKKLHFTPKNLHLRHRAKNCWNNQNFAKKVYLNIENDFTIILKHN